MSLDKEGLCAVSSRQRRSSIVLTVLIVATLCCCCVQAGDSHGDNFFLFMRKRLGHFSKYGPNTVYGPIYKEYFTSVIQKNDIAMENIDINDWRYVRPSGDTCIEFLIGFQVREYILSKPFDIIPLDSCLDWVFDESDEKELDMGRLRASQKKEVKELKQDPKLKQLFESTKYNRAQLPQTLTDQVYEYLSKLLKIYSENPKNGCHSLWLQAYIDFIEDVYLGDCEDEEKCDFYKYPDSAKDSYLSLIAESSKEASRSCYRVMQTQMKGLVEQEYDSSKSVPTSLAMKFRTRSNRVNRQSEKEKWSREMIGILQLAAGTDQDKPINLADVVDALDRIKSGNSETIQRFTGALSQYAIDNVDIKDSANDPTGRNRYGKAMGKLCRPYIDQTTFLPQAGGAPLDDEDEDNRKPFEFYNLIYSLVRITNHEPTFMISKEKLENDVLANHWEALYLATFACQIISTTWGSLDYETNTGSFNVKLRPNSRVLIEDWPIEVMNEKLPLIYGKGESRAADNKLSFDFGDSSASTGLLGREFKGIFGKKEKNSEKKFSLKSLFGHNSNSNVVKSAPEPEPEPVAVPAPVKPAAPVYHPPAAVAPVNRVTPGVQSAPVGTQLSPETLRMFKELKGYYPQPDKPGEPLPAVFSQAYAAKEPERPFVKPAAEYRPQTTTMKPETTSKSSADRWASISI